LQEFRIAAALLEQRSRFQRRCCWHCAVVSRSSQSQRARSSVRISPAEQPAKHLNRTVSLSFSTSQPCRPSNGTSRDEGTDVSSQPCPPDVRSSADSGSPCALSACRRSAISRHLGVKRYATATFARDCHADVIGIEPIPANDLGRRPRCSKGMTRPIRTHKP